MHRSRFRKGSKLRLADNRLWTLPAPPYDSRGGPAPFRIEHAGLLKAIVEADYDFERRLAELAFVVFLLGENYALSPADYERLLAFGRPRPILDALASGHASALSQLNCRVDRLEFRSGVVDLYLPIDALLRLVDVA
jgi:hypothetical protein